MKVIVGDITYNSDDERIILMLLDEEKNDISVAKMNSQTLTYTKFPKAWWKNGGRDEEEKNKG